MKSFTSSNRMLLLSKMPSAMARMKSPALSGLTSRMFLRSSSNSSWMISRISSQACSPESM